MDSVEECGCTCVSTRGCTGFEWEKAVKGCYLKDAVTEHVKHANLISGVLNC